MACTELKVAPPDGEDWICPQCLEKMERSRLAKRRKGSAVNGVATGGARGADKKGAGGKVEEGRRGLSSRKR